MITVHGANATVEELRRIPLVRPEDAGGWWRGIQHGELVDTLTARVEFRGWEVTDRKFSVAKKGADLAGALGLRIPRMPELPGMTPSLGFLTSNDRSRALRIYCGADVTVCSNGLATGRIVLRRNHTKWVSLVEELDYALDDYAISTFKIPRIVVALRDRTLAEGEYEHCLLEAGRRGLMPWSRLADVDREYRIPRFEGEFGRENLWALLNAFTWVVKRNPPARQMEQIDGFRSMLPTVAA